MLQVNRTPKSEVLIINNAFSYFRINLKIHSLFIWTLFDILHKLLSIHTLLLVINCLKKKTVILLKVYVTEKVVLFRKSVSSRLKNITIKNVHNYFTFNKYKIIS